MKIDGVIEMLRRWPADIGNDALLRDDGGGKKWKRWRS